MSHAVARQYLLLAISYISLPNNKARNNYGTIRFCKRIRQKIIWQGR